jgi:hypothetical protein
LKGGRVRPALAPAGGLSASGALSAVAGVFTGSLLWWCLVVVLANGFRHAIGRTVRTWIDRVAGAILACFGAVELARAISIPVKMNGFWLSTSPPVLVSA